ATYKNSSPLPSFRELYSESCAGVKAGDMRDSRWTKGKHMRCRYALLLVLWVLWSELLGDGKPEWNSIDTFNTEAACTEESQQRASRAKQNRKVLNSGPTHFTYRSVSGTYMLSYICVPDSVDPRPK